jgi:hypothetical protein
VRFDHNENTQQVSKGHKTLSPARLVQTKKDTYTGALSSQGAKKWNKNNAFVLTCIRFGEREDDGLCVDAPLTSDIRFIMSETYCMIVYV